MSQRNLQSGPEQNRFAHWLIRRAAERAPESLSARLEEEWLADLESRSTAFARLRFALGCRWASLVIAGEFSRNQVPASGSISAAGVVTLADRNFGYFSLRSATLFLIAGLHAALFYGLITTLQHSHRLATPPDLQNTDVQPVPPEAPPPLPTGLESKVWTFKLPSNLQPQTIDIETEITPDIPKIPELSSPPSGPETPAHVIQHVAGGPGSGFPETGDYYPSPSIRAGEEGYTTVQACVDPRGRLMSAPLVLKSSGSQRLDAGALKLAQAGSGHYRPSTEDGKPVASCYPFGIRFQLRR